MVRASKLTWEAIKGASVEKGSERKSHLYKCACFGCRLLYPFMRVRNGGESTLLMYSGVRVSVCPEGGTDFFPLIQNKLYNDKFLWGNMKRTWGGGRLFTTTNRRPTSKHHV